MDLAPVRDNYRLAMDDIIFHLQIIYTCNTITFLWCKGEKFVGGDKTLLHEWFCKSKYDELPIAMKGDVNVDVDVWTFIMFDVW